MKLTILERLVILGILPAEGDILFLRMRQGMIAKVGLDAIEMETYEVKQNPDGTVSWRNDLPYEAEVELSDVEKGIVKDALMKLSRERKLTPNHLSLYEKFCETEKGA